MERVVWVDVIILALLANFAFDYLLLWATAEVSRTPTTRGRLAAGALLGTLYFLAYLLAQAGLLPLYGLLRLVPVVFLVSVLMLAVTFYPLNPRRLLSVGGYFYLIGFAAAGAGLAGAHLAGSPQEPRMAVGFVVALTTILALAELGWGVVQRRIWQHMYQVPVSLRFGDRELSTVALVDTGNRLRDPLSGHPVMIVEAESFSTLFPPSLYQWIRDHDKPDLNALTQILAQTPWSSRFRLIPYHSIDREHGMLIGFRPDEIMVRTGSESLSTRDVIVGICQRRLDPEGVYHALIHPEILQRGLAAGSAHDPEERKAGISLEAREAKGVR